MRRRKLLIVAAATAAALVVALAVVFTVDWDSPRLGAAVLGEVGRVAGIELQADGFRLNLMRGLELRGVKARGALPAGALEASMDRLLLEHRLLPLLSRRVVVERLVLERPEIHLRSAGAAAASGGARSRAGEKETAADPASQEPAAADGGPALDLALSRMAIEGGSLVMQEEGQPAATVELRGLDLELRDLRLDPEATSVLAGLSAEGELAAGASTLAAIRASELSGKVTLAGGHVIMREVRMPANLGRFTVSELDVDLTRDPYRFAVALAGDPLDTKEMLGAAGGTLGVTRLDLSTSGDLGDSLDLDGKGSLSIEVGRLPDAPVLSSLDRLLPKVPLVGELYEPFEIHFRLDGEKIVADLFEIVAGEVRLQARGVVGLDRTFDLRVVARAPRELLESPEIPKEVLEALTDAEGLVSLPILVRGSQSEPVARFDRSQWASLARERLQNEAKEELQRRLGDLLGGKKKRKRGDGGS
jgi:hypothetical protein